MREGNLSAHPLLRTDDREQRIVALVPDGMRGPPPSLRPPLQRWGPHLRKLIGLLAREVVAEFLDRCHATDARRAFPTAPVPVPFVNPERPHQRALEVRSG